MKDIYDYAENNDDIEFHFVTTHMDKIGLTYQYIPEKESKNIMINKYETPKQLLGVLASMDIFITSMLHLGLTGLTLGTPFLSYRGPGKTKSFLKSIKGDWAIVNDNTSFNGFNQEFFSKSKTELFAQYDVNALNKMILESENHYKQCSELVNRFG